MDKTKIIFWGTPEFAEIILEKLIQDKNLEILAVVTAPDKPVGRKHVLTPSPTKILAKKNNIKILQPEKLDEEFIKKLKKNINHPLVPSLKRKGDSNIPDLNIVVAYGKIIPLKILNIPKYKSIDIHPSILPKYRGASPIQTALLNGDKKTGVTIMQMDEKMDHGEIISKLQITISNNDNYKILAEKLAELSAKLLIKTIPEYISGKIQPAEQEHNKASFCKIIKKQDGEINWENNAEQIFNQSRAFCEWPGIFSQLTINNKQLTIKFIEIKLTNLKSNKPVSDFFVKNKQLFITCGNNSVLEIIQLQPEGKKIMNAGSFINGFLSSLRRQGSI